MLLLHLLHPLLLENKHGVGANPLTPFFIACPLSPPVNSFIRKITLGKLTYLTYNLLELCSSNWIDSPRSAFLQTAQLLMNTRTRLQRSKHADRK